MPSCFLLALVAAQFMLVSSKSQNLLDRAVWNIMVLNPCRVVNEETLNKWTTLLESTVFAISDTHLTTSMALLVSGFIQLSRGMALYNWQTTVNLSWFSAIIYLTTLTSQRLSMRSKSSMATWRVLVMGGLLILLSVAFWPTGYAWQRDYEQDSVSTTHPNLTIPFNSTNDLRNHLVSSPAICWYSSRSRKLVMEQVASFENTEISPTDAKGGYHFFNSCLVGISISYLMASYLTRVTRLYGPVARILDHWFKIVPLAFLQKCYQSAESKQRRSVLQKSYAYRRFTVLVVVVLAEAFYEVVDSFLWEILWLGAALIWGTLRLVALRSQNPLPEEAKAQWGFGSVLPLLFSIFPIWYSITEPSNSQFSDLCRNATSCPVQGNRDFSVIREIRQTLWFRSLTVLILGKAIVIAAYVVAEYPAASVSGRTPGLDTLAYSPGRRLLLCLIILIAYLLVLTVFVSMCLKFHCRKSKAKPLSRANGTYLESSVGHHRHRACAVGWAFLVLTILAVEATGMIFLFVKPGYLAHSILKV